MVRQALGNGKPAKSSGVNSIPLERQFSEEGERKEGKEDEEEEEEKEEKNNNSHTYTSPCAPAAAATAAAWMCLRWHLGALPHSVSLVPKRRSASCH